VKIPKWLQRGTEEKPTSKAETRKNVRQQTDQLLKQQAAQKERQQDEENKKKLK
jgi:hypothetical protein